MLVTRFKFYLATLVFTSCFLLIDGSGAANCWDDHRMQSECCAGAGPTACWQNGLTLDACCRKSGHPVQPQEFVKNASGTSDDAAAHRDGFSDVSRRCWRSGYTYSHCCNTGTLGGDPSCWEHGSNFNYNYCCRPPPPPVGFNLFEDVNCDRSQQPGSWPQLREYTEAFSSQIASASDFDFLIEVDPDLPFRFTRGFEKRLKDALLEARCPFGVLAVRLAQLFLCVAQKRKCNAFWAAAAAALRNHANSITKWGATSWPVLALWQSISLRTASPDPSCNERNPMRNWQDFHAMSKGEAELDERRIMKELPRENSLECSAGHEFLHLFQVQFGAQTEATAAVGSIFKINQILHEASLSGMSLRIWSQRFGDWKLGHLHDTWLKGSMRHSYQLCFTEVEMQFLGLAVPKQSGCTEMIKDTADVDWRAIPIDTILNLTVEDCYSACAGSLTSSGGPSVYSAVMPTRAVCMCAGGGVELYPHPECSSLGLSAVHALQSMPPSSLIRRFRNLMTSGPTRKGGLVLPAAASSVDVLKEGTVFVSMIFGRMAKHLPRVARHLARIGVPNVVLYTLDEETYEACNELVREVGSPTFCLQGANQSPLQKYEIVLIYLCLGFNVFWFDFDSIWMQNPAPVLQDLLTGRRTFIADGERRRGFGIPPESRASVLAAIDVDTANGAMNAFFWIRCSEETINWMVFLLRYVYERPWIHDQLAFSVLLGAAPLVDSTPLPRAPVWAALDPNIFVNAHRFEGLGFWGDYEDVVFFHFFAGWNSNKPDDVEKWATPTYRGLNLFEVFYSGDESQTRAMIERSKIEKVPPDKLKDTRFATSLGLGVEVNTHLVEVPLLPSWETTRFASHG